MTFRKACLRAFSMLPSIPGAVASGKPFEALKQEWKLATQLDNALELAEGRLARKARREVTFPQVVRFCVGGLVFMCVGATLLVAAAWLQRWFPVVGVVTLLLWGLWFSLTLAGRPSNTAGVLAFWLAFVWLCWPTLEKLLP